MSYARTYTDCDKLERVRERYAERQFQGRGSKEVRFLTLPPDYRVAADNSMLRRPGDGPGFRILNPSAGALMPPAYRRFWQLRWFAG
jgi:hypothetical protein